MRYSHSMTTDVSTTSIPAPVVKRPAGKNPLEFTFRWYGPDDPVSLAHIRQIPGTSGIVTALHDIPAGQTWPLARIEERQRHLAAHGLHWSVVESIPVHESIKLGEPKRDTYIQCYIESIRNVGAAGIGTLCYNFMPVFDWLRTNFAMPLPDGSTTMQYLQADCERIDLGAGIERLPAWAQGYSGDELAGLFARYQGVDAEVLFSNFAYFLEAVVPEAERAGVRLAVHPDDPPWPIFGLPRIVNSHETIERVLDVVDSEYNGLTFCTGSLAASRDNRLIEMVRAFGPRINFVHARNVSRSGDRDFYEAAHPSCFGVVDMVAVLRALHDVGFAGPIRPDHGRMIWGEAGTPGYGLYHRALGATYLLGVAEAVAWRS
jgi:mannonate dehydratase